MSLCLIFALAVKCPKWEVHGSHTINVVRLFVIMFASYGACAALIFCAVEEGEGDGQCCKQLNNAIIATGALFVIFIGRIFAVPVGRKVYCSHSFLQKAFDTCASSRCDCTSW